MEGFEQNFRVLKAEKGRRVRFLIYTSPDLSEAFLLSDFFSLLLPFFVVKYNEEGLI